MALYVRDPGASNTFVGHRRWVLYPLQTEMGTGSTSTFDALWIIGAFAQTRPVSPAFVAWPNPGLVPFPVVYPRWSFSPNTNSAVDFSTATVSMTRAGSPFGLTVLPVNTGGFGDQTIVWEPASITTGPGMADATFTVTVANVRVAGVPTQYTYDVTIIDPDTVSVSGVVPNVGPLAGGTPVSVLGSKFVAPATVTFGGSPATSVNVVNANTITAVTPAHALGAVGVTVTASGISSTLADAYFYFDPPPPTRLHTLTPCRVVDTRNPVTGDGRGGPILAPLARRNFNLTGACAIPPGAKALSLNLTVTGGAAAGHVSLFPGNGVAPATSNINFAGGQTRANNAVVLLATNGSGLLAAFNGSSGAVHLILDVNGYFE